MQQVIDHQARVAPKCSESEMPSFRKESDLHAEIMEECKRRGWLSFHGSMAHRAMRTIGEPDFTVLADKGRVFFIEAKSKTGKLRPEQIGLAMMAERLGHKIHCVRSMAEFLTATAGDRNMTDQLQIKGTGKTRKRKVYGRRIVLVDGKEVKFEMTTDGIRIREKHQRRVETVSFSRLFDAATGQTHLPI
jgi:hypothetical protein